MEENQEKEMENVQSAVSKLKLSPSNPFNVSKEFNCEEKKFYTIKKGKEGEKNMNPVREFVTSPGLKGVVRVESIFAVIKTRHIKLANERESLSPEVDDHFNQMKIGKDEKGHLVAATFSGPSRWYNIVAMNKRVNRNVGKEEDGMPYSDWLLQENGVRDFLSYGLKSPGLESPGRPTRWVKWKVQLIYDNNSNRPKEFILEVQKYERGAKNPVSTHRSTIQNPILELAD